MTKKINDNKLDIFFFVWNDFDLLIYSDVFGIFNFFLAELLMTIDELDKKNFSVELRF